MGWRVCSDDEILVELRCPECFVWMEGAYTAGEMRELDRITAERREAVVRAHQRFVAEAMEALADCFSAALALDLVGADDFAPRSVTLA